MIPLHEYAVLMQRLEAEINNKIRTNEQMNHDHSALCDQMGIDK